jgi:hypothetical protein
MVDTKQFNSLPLLSVKSGLDSSLAQISAELESYFNEGWAGSRHLQMALDELHRAVGVLQMLSLEGLAVSLKQCCRRCWHKNRRHPPCTAILCVAPYWR